MPEPTNEEQHTIAVLVDNEPGVLARVIGLFSGRGYNIESLTVAETDPQGGLSRITIVTSGTPMIIEQIKAQLGRLVPVHKVSDLTVEGDYVEREMALIKVCGTGEHRVEALRIADIFRAPRGGQHQRIIRVRNRWQNNQGKCIYWANAAARVDGRGANRRRRHRSRLGTHLAKPQQPLGRKHKNACLLRQRCGR